MTFNMLFGPLRFTAAIYVAAPAAALLSYLSVSGYSFAPGTRFDAFGSFLFYFTIAMFLVRVQYVYLLNGIPSPSLRECACML